MHDRFLTRLFWLTLAGDEKSTIELFERARALGGLHRHPGAGSGPLLDSAGRLIGIDTAIYSASIGFAVPVDNVNRVAPDLIAHGQYLRPSLGIEIDEELKRNLRRASGIPGVAILRVAPPPTRRYSGVRAKTMHGTTDTLYEDAMIAATAQVHNRTVVTRNIADFRTSA